MPTTLDVSKCNRNERMDKVIIYLCMSVGMHEITEKNWEEFFTRVHIYEQCFGAFWRDENGEPVYTTHQDIKDYIGTHTNVRTLTKAEFKSNVWLNLLRDSETAE